MLIVLFGTSSSGKTSIAQALQILWPRPLLLIEADRSIPTIAPQRFAECDDDFKKRFIVAMHESIAVFGRSGIDTVVNGSLPVDPVLRDRCFSILRGIPDTKVVAVRCSTETLRQREASRPDRLKGWAEQQALTLYDGVAFDANVDTTNRSSGDCASLLLQTLFPENN